MTEKTLEYKSWFIMLLSCFWLTKIYEINGIRESTKLFLHAISSGGVPVWMINASIMESMDCSDQHIEPKMFGSTKKASGDFCCVPGCSNQIGNDKMNEWKPLYYLIFLLQHLLCSYGSFSSNRWLVGILRKSVI